MKKFYAKIFLFIMFIVVIVVGIGYLSVTEEYRVIVAKLTNSEEYITGVAGAEEITPFIKKVQEKNSYTKLIIGDSVCNQMYNDLQEYNEDICIAGTNAAITVAGQYIIAEKFLENHDNVTDIWLIITPSSLGRSFDTSPGYIYTVMPFVETDTLNLLDDNTLNHMESVYGKVFMDKNVEWIIKRSGIIKKLYLNELSKHAMVEDEGALAETSIQYIEKLKKLCDEKGVTLHLYSGPCADIEETHTYIEKQFKEEYENSVLYQYYPEYIKQIWYYPDEHFRDSVHFGGDWANQDAYNEKIKEMYSGMELLENLRFE